MITITRIKNEDLDNPWLNEALTKGIKESLTAPVICLNPSESEAIVRTRMLIDNFSKENCKAIPTIIVPGGLVQMVLPEEEILVSIIFLKDNGKDTKVQVSLIKLNHEENETTTTVHT